MLCNLLQLVFIQIWWCFSFFIWLAYSASKLLHKNIFLWSSVGKFSSLVRCQLHFTWLWVTYERFHESQKLWVHIRPQSKEKGTKTTWVQSNTSKAIKSKGISSVAKIFGDPVCWQLPLLCCSPIFPWHQSSKRTILSAEKYKIHMTRCIIASACILFISSAYSLP